MNKFLALVRLNFRAMLVAFSLGKSKKRAAGGTSAIIFLALLALYISGTYSFLMYSMFSPKLLQFYFAFMALYGCLMAFLLTAFSAGGFLFGGRDNDIMLTLPVSIFSVLLSRVAALYLENLLFCGFWMVPVCAVYAFQSGVFSAALLFLSLASLVLLPLLSTALGIVVGLGFTWISARFQRKALLTSLLNIGLVGIIFVMSFQIQRLPVLLLSNAAAFAHILSTWLLPIGLLNDALYKGSTLAMAAFAALCGAALLLIVWLVSLRYQALLTSLSSRRAHGGYKLHSVEARKPFAALFRKELRRYFGTSAYLVNTIVGPLLLLGGTVYLCFSAQTVLPVLEQLGHEALPGILALGLAFILSTVCVTASSVSLEGRNLWILQEAPVPVHTIFGAKFLLHTLVAVPVCLICLIPLAVVLSLPVGEALVLAILCILFGTHGALSGLMLNLWFPKLDCDNPTLVVKQSASVLLAMLESMVTAAIAAGLYFVLGGLLGFVGFGLLVSALFLAANIVQWRWLTRTGTQLFAALQA